MGLNKELQTIYSFIPEMNCKQGCHECCGPITWSPVEDMSIKEYMKEHNITDVHWSVKQYVANNFLCPYIKDDKCIIYPVRPIVCRLQGHIKKLPCPHKKDFDVSKQLEDQIMRKIMKLNKNYLEEKYVEIRA